MVGLSLMETIWRQDLIDQFFMYSYLMYIIFMQWMIKTLTMTNDFPGFRSELNAYFHLSQNKFLVVIIDWIWDVFKALTKSYVKDDI